MQFAHQRFPRLTAGIGFRKADFDCGFPGMTDAAKRLQIARRIGQIRARPHWFDMVNFKPPMVATLHATPFVTVQNLEPQNAPAFRFGDVPGMAFEVS